MALEREKTNVQIGNMPYVRPSNVLGSLATEVQQEAINRKKEIEAEEEQIEIATKTAQFFNGITGITEGQERPDAQSAGIEIGKLHKRITSEKETPNGSVRRRLQASFQGIMSSTFNKILKAQTALETEEAIERKKQAIETTLDVANLDAEAGAEENIGLYKSQIEQLGNELVSVSRGTITQSQANEIIRTKQFEMDVTDIATRYTTMMSEGNAVGAEKYLTNAVERYGKTLKEEKGFRRLFADELKINGFDSKIQRAQVVEFARFNAMKLADQEKYLVENSDKMEPAIFESYNNVAIARRLDIEGITLDDSLVNMGNQQSAKNIELLGRKLIDQYPRQAGKIRTAIKTNKTRLLKDAAASLAKEEKLNNGIIDGISYQELVGKQKKYEIIPDQDTLVAPSGRRYTSTQSTNLINANNQNKRIAAEVQDRGTGASVTPLSPDSDQAQFIDAQFEKFVGEKLNTYLNDDTIPQNNALALQIGETLNQYNYIPKQIRNLFTSDILQMPSSQIKKVSEIYYGIVQGGGKHLQEDVSNVLANIPVDFARAMQFAKDGSLQAIDAFKADIMNTKGPGLVPGTIEKRTDATIENLEAIPNALIKGNVESSYLGRAWDKAWNQVLGDTLSVSPWWSAYMSVTRPSALSSEFQSWRNGGFQGILFGFDADDFTSAMDQQTSSLYKNALKQVFAENPNISDEQAASFAIDKIADVTTPSIYMAADPERADDDRSNLYQLHAYSPEAMLMNEKLPPNVRMNHDEVSVAMIETARVALIANMEASGKGQKYLEDMFNLRPDGPDRVLFSPAAKNGALKVDMGLMMLAGRLAFKNGRKDAKTGQMSYEIHIATQGLERNDKFVWKKIRVPGSSASTAYHFPIGKNIPAMTEPRSFHSDFARLQTFADSPSLLLPAAFYKTKEIYGMENQQKFNEGVMGVIRKVGEILD